MLLNWQSPTPGEAGRSTLDWNTASESGEERIEQGCTIVATASPARSGRRRHLAAPRGAFMRGRTVNAWLRKSFMAPRAVSPIRRGSRSHTAERTATPALVKSAVQKAKLGQDEELGTVRRLDEESRRLERFAKGPSVEAFIIDERARSYQYGGCSVFG
jgi:hypothetical protein